MTLYFAHNIFTRNIGDLSCCPASYFREFGGYPITDLCSGPFESVVFGGGGIHETVLDTLALCKAVPRIIWGMGTNLSYGRPAIYPVEFQSYDLVGLRDYGNPFRYVPCPSCMSIHFDRFKNIVPTRKIGIYEQYPSPLILPFESLNNHKDHTMEQCLSFIASCSIIITNSYHGAYWSQLLGRSVVTWNQMPNKFKYLKYPPREVDHIDKIEEYAINAPQEYLEECRDLNRKFATEVANILG